jgi:hypothetical protein
MTRRVTLDGVHLVSDVARGDWLLERVGEFGHVDGTVGGGFDAYARILHPLTAYREDRTVTDQWGDHPVLETTTWRWATVAERTGGTMHPLVQWTRLTGVDDESDVSFPDGWRASPPEEGWFDPATLAALTEHLAAATTTPEDLVAGFWDGWGDLNGGSTLVVGWQSDDEPTSAEREALLADAERLTAEHRAAQDALVASLAGPRFAWPNRDLILLQMGLSQLADPTWLGRAEIGHYRDFGHTPQLLWPEDRTWAMASEIDWDSTIVAGSRSLVESILADDRFEAFEVDEHDDLSWSSDVIDRNR